MFKIKLYTMSFSRYKVLTRLAQITLCSTESIQDTARRFYSKKVIFSSSSPHALKLRISQPAERKKKVRGVTYRKKDEIDEQLIEKGCTELAENLVDEAEEIVEDYTRIEHRTNKVHKHNYKLTDNTFYQKELTFDDQTTEVVQLNHNPAISDSRILTTLSNKENAKDLDNSQIDIKEKENNSQTDITEKENDSQTDIKENNSNFDDLNIEQDFNRYKIIQTSEGELKFDLSSDEFDLKKFYEELKDALTVPKPLDTCKEDLSDFGPNFPATFNFAAYADKSKLVQEFVKLGVKLYKVEQNQDHMRALLTVDLEKELPVYIQFLHDCGVPADCLGDVITENPMILKEDLDDMKTRIRYLRAHEFAKESIARIVTLNPTWLMWATKKIDERLGHFQNQFKLTGAEVRFLATKQPKLITYNMKHIHENTFAIVEQMGFKQDERKVLLLAKPRIWMNSRKKILDSFDYLHKTMQLSHLVIASQPDLLTCRRSRLKNRYEFLQELKKVQFDPKEPGYLEPRRIAFGSDAEFCRDIAKVSVETYNLFLKTR